MSTEISKRLEKDLGMTGGEALRGFFLTLFTAGFGNVLADGLARSREEKQVQASGRKRQTTAAMTLESPDGTKYVVTKSQIDRAFDLDLFKQNRQANDMLKRMNEFFADDGVIDA